jgi:mannitol/fructose-specific phosphotransferase system IIA component (Ntr-type)
VAAILCDILDEKHVTLVLRARTRDEALREIIATMADAVELAEPEKFFAEVVAREEANSTYMGNGVAFPHARTDLVQRILLGIGRSAEGIAFGAAGELVHLLFVIAVPRRMVNEYLVCVGALARVVKEPETREALMNAATAAELLEVIREASLLLK